MWKGSDWMRVGELIGDRPEGVRETDTDGNLPLHLAAATGAPVQAIRALISADPSVLSMRDADGCLPLHIAASSFPSGGSTTEAFEAILQGLPECARKKDSLFGRLPLHSAVEHLAPLVVVQMLLDVYPEGASERDLDGNLPIHLAIESHASEAVWKALGQANPQAVFAKGSNGRLPDREPPIAAVHQEEQVSSGASTPGGQENRPEYLVPTCLTLFPISLISAEYTSPLLPSAGLAAFSRQPPPQCRPRAAVSDRKAPRAGRIARDKTAAPCAPVNNAGGVAAGCRRLDCRCTLFSRVIPLGGPRSRGAATAHERHVHQPLRHKHLIQDAWARGVRHRLPRAVEGNDPFCGRLLLFCVAAVSCELIVPARWALIPPPRPMTGRCLFAAYV